MAKSKKTYPKTFLLNGKRMKVNSKEEYELWNNPIRDSHCLYYDKNGEPISLKEFVEKIEKDKNYKRVGITELYGKTVFISTVWLGIDYTFLPTKGVNPLPLIFETMIFSKFTGVGREIEMNRYFTETQAKQGHEEFVNKYKNPLYAFYKITSVFLSDLRFKLQIKWIDLKNRLSIVPPQT